MKSLSIALLSASILASLPAIASPLQIKGIRLGQHPTEACSNSVITSKLDDIVNKYKGKFPNLIYMNTQECHLKAETFGGLKIASGIDLLFLENELIQLKLELIPMHWMEYSRIFAPLTEMYGAPAITKESRFTTHTWNQANNTLSVSRLDTESGVASLEITLRDNSSIKIYDEKVKTNMNILKAPDEERIKADIKY